MTDENGLMRSLRTAVDVPVSAPGDARYAAATPWNVAVDVSPLAVIHVTRADDVAATLRWAAAHDRRVAVQRTGHGATDRGDDVVLIDTRGLDRLDLDPATRTAVIGAGRTFADVIEAGAEHGLLPVLGSAPGIAVAGLVTGGGCGPLVRTHGASSDWVRSFTVVTGDGEIRRASHAEDADLFWGLRGGKATLGIVTEIELELLALESFYGGCAYFDAPDIPAVVRGWQAWSHALPSEGTTSICILQLPEGIGAPPPLEAKMTLAVRLVWLGDEGEGAQLAGELLSLATPILGGFERMPATEIGMVHADPVDPMPIREHGFLLADFPAPAAEALLASAGPGAGSELLMAEIRRMDPPASPSPDAFCGRDAPYNVLAATVPMPDSTSGLPSATAVLDALAPWATGHVMPNFVTSADPDMLARYWQPATLARLQELGDRYDPDGVLRVGQVARRAPDAVTA